MSFSCCLWIRDFDLGHIAAAVLILSFILTQIKLMQIEDLNVKPLFRKNNPHRLGAYWIVQWIHYTKKNLLMLELRDYETKCHNNND